MTFEETYTNRINQSTTLWRYIDLHKLLDLSINKHLHFTRLDQFNDPFEGVTYSQIVSRHLALSGEITNPNIPEEFAKTQNQKNHKDLEVYDSESQLMRKTQFVNCWFKSDRESHAMWNLYSNKDSIAIKINAKELIRYLENTLKLQVSLLPNHKFICGSVNYVKLNPVDLFDKPKLPKYSAFKKDVSFDYEKEYRLLIVSRNNDYENNPTFIKVPITNNFLKLTEIVCHPEIGLWKYENLVDICKKYKLPTPKKSEVELL